MNTHAYSPNLLDRLNVINANLHQRFPNGNEPFQIATRLLEECGELAAEVNHFEGSGIKEQKHGIPNKHHLAKEAQQVIRCVLQLIDYYDAHTEFEESINDSYQRMVAGEL